MAKSVVLLRALLVVLLVAVCGPAVDGGAVSSPACIAACMAGPCALGVLTGMCHQT